MNRDDMIETASEVGDDWREYSCYGPDVDVTLYTVYGLLTEGQLMTLAIIVGNSIKEAREDEDLWLVSELMSIYSMLLSTNMGGNKTLGDLLALLDQEPKLEQQD